MFERPRPPKPPRPKKPILVKPERPVLTRPERPAFSKPEKPRHATPVTTVRRPATIEQVAEWMLAQLQEVGFLSQSLCCVEISLTFEGDFIHLDKSGNKRVRPALLKAFRKISIADVVWIRSELTWRKRNEHHGPGREQP